MNLLIFFFYYRVTHSFDWSRNKERKINSSHQLISTSEREVCKQRFQTVQNLRTALSISFRIGEEKSKPIHRVTCHSWHEQRTETGERERERDSLRQEHPKHLLIDRKLEVDRSVSGSGFRQGICSCFKKAFTAPVTPSSFSIALASSTARSFTYHWSSFNKIM